MTRHRQPIPTVRAVSFRPPPELVPNASMKRWRANGSSFNSLDRAASGWRKDKTLLDHRKAIKKTSRS
ncbi:MAG TPA: hypothetical protein ENH55_01330 [Aurantimonas coralicida]|uniref:Uncharacterized protein n=1 Tax=Aurantimonas coralicida TaxID=182270 RepID=A0A9C9NGE6_9HYPH|nr:hypothetical protein [Aurantimonas coralicida]HEU01221.1 hypothetical protein [Aurantimonas coralicida]